MDTIPPGPAPSLALDFCGLQFASPIVLLSGCVGFGEEYTRVAGFSNRDAGAIVLKGTTLEPRLGNPPHRVTETPDGMINAIGLQNPGVDHVVRKILPTLDFTETRFIANVCGSTIEEYVEVTRRFDDSPIDAMEINISCPNVKEGGVQFGNYPEMSARVVAACRKATKKPLITKLSPNQTDIRENARLCIEAGSDGLAVINTISGMAIDVATRRPVIGNVQGGISGPAIKPIALLKVKQVYEVAGPEGVPIIGQGGIANAADALEFLIAGASAVGVGTALFYDPLLCRRSMPASPPTCARSASARSRADRHAVRAAPSAGLRRLLGRFRRCRRGAHGARRRIGELPMSRRASSSSSRSRIACCASMNTIQLRGPARNTPLRRCSAQSPIAREVRALETHVPLARGSTASMIAGISATCSRGVS